MQVVQILQRPGVIDWTKPLRFPKGIIVLVLHNCTFLTYSHARAVMKYKAIERLQLTAQNNSVTAEKIFCTYTTLLSYNLDDPIALPQR